VSKERVPYTYEECERMTALYEEDYANPVHVIAEIINEEFHNNKPVRNRKAVYYGIGLYNDGKIEEDLS